MYRNFFKHVLDFFISFIGFIIFSPIFLLLWILLSIANKGAGAFFFQERPGKKERLFKVIKFKTMTDERDSKGNLLPDAQRLTKVGKFVRSTSLDEIPQLLNVLKGDMSLVGPRPLLVKYLPYYTPREQKRHNVRPGLTGLSQVSGRNNLDWENRLETDVVYVENISFLLDLKILYKTFLTVIQPSENIGLNVIEDFDAYRQKQKIK